MGGLPAALQVTAMANIILELDDTLRMVSECHHSLN